MTRSNQAIRTDKAAGIVLGAAVGDALGWPQEDRSQIVGGAVARDVEPRPVFREWQRNAGTQFGRYLETVGAGEYSDDTQLLLAVARSSLRRANWFDWLTQVELPQWPLYQRGGGGAVLRASRAWADGHPPWVPAPSKDARKLGSYFNAGANGVAMRIAPHSIVTANQGADDLLHRVVLDGLATHGHPRALIGGCIHALAVRHALLQEATLEYGELLDAIWHEPAWRDPNLLLDSIDPDWVNNFHLSERSRDTPAELWTRTVGEVELLINIARSGLSKGAMANDQRTLDEFGCFDKKQSGSGTVTAIAAIYVTARTATRPVGGLLRTGFLRNADTDTLCSMTGSLLGALHGSQWLGELGATVQDREHLIGVAVDLADMANGGTVREPRRTSAPVATTSKELRSWSKRLFDDGAVDVLPDGRPFDVIEIRELRTKTSNFVARAIGVTIDGQTLMLDRVVTNRPDTLVGKPSTAVTKPVEESQRPTVAAPDNGTKEPTSKQTTGTADTGPRPIVTTEASVVTVEISVPDLVAAARFFQELLGLPCRRANDKVHIDQVLVLGQAKPGHEQAHHRGTIITIAVGNLREIADKVERTSNVECAWSTDRQSLWLKDPGDNRIRLVQTQTPSRVAVPFDSKSEATQGAREMTRDVGLGEVTVHGTASKDGRDVQRALPFEGADNA
jgi:ADP-ribosylglycohydrolase